MNKSVQQLPEEVVTPEIQAICKRYRIEPEEARDILEQYVDRHPKALKQILAKYPSEDITRLKAYKTLIKHVRKQIYYYLRQYQTDKQTIQHLRQQLFQAIQISENPDRIHQIIWKLLLTHVSTKERVEFYPEFYRKIFERIKPPRTILDLGCGLHPLSYPFEQSEYCPDRYVAIDKNPEVIETLTIFALYAKPTHLITVQSDIAGIDWVSYLEHAHDTFDAVFMLKLIPVIFRQQRNLLPKLAEVPARQMVITAAMESMTRKENIRRKEAYVMRQFIEMTEKEIIDSFEIENEFGYLLE